jgi:hypothetical protein
MSKGWRLFGAASALVLPWVVAGCSRPEGAAATTVAPEEVLAELSQGVTWAEANTAATHTANHSQACKGNGNFYWEIGSRNGAIVSGSVVNNSSVAGVDATTSMPIASASKLIFAAYVLETCGGVACTTPGNPVPSHLALRMMSSYLGTQQRCVGATGSTTVDQCAQSAGIYHEPAAVDAFSYSGGQFQAFAWGEPHLTNLNAGGLAYEINAWLGTDFSYGHSAPNPWLAGGAGSTPANYALFLQRILLSYADPVNGLKIFGALGQDEVDAYYSAHSTPVTAQAWGYSYGHWVENIEGRVAKWDGAYSSPGSFGFYPWIAKGKQLYGLVARNSGGGFWPSVVCGQAIRRAFYTGQAQP